MQISSAHKPEGQLCLIGSCSVCVMRNLQISQCFQTLWAWWILGTPYVVRKTKTQMLLLIMCFPYRRFSSSICILERLVLNFFVFMLRSLSESGKLMVFTLRNKSWCFRKRDCLAIFLTTLFLNLVWFKSTIWQAAVRRVLLVGELTLSHLHSSWVLWKTSYKWLVLEVVLQQRWKRKPRYRLFLTLWCIK